MFFKRVKTDGLGQNSYVVGCGNGLAVVVDPRRDIDVYLQAARDEGLTISHIIHTHRQEDYVFGSAALMQVCGAQIIAGKHDCFGKVDIALGDGEELAIGTAKIKALETPGHTPESMSFAMYVKDAGEKAWGVFTGDTLFVGGTGRTDLPDPQRTEENAGKLYDSVHQKIAPLGDQTFILPAHGSGSACGASISERDESTLGIEMNTNDVFTLSRAEFITTKKNEKMARPPYFRHMEEVNLRHGIPVQTLHPMKVLQPVDLNTKLKQDCCIIDCRSPEAFAGGHIPGSYSIWLEGIPAFGGWVAHHQSQIYLVANSAEDANEAVMGLARIGIDGVAGVLVDGMESWRKEGLPLARVDTVTADAVAGMESVARYYVLDVRDEYEWEEEHIPGALHTFVGYLEKNLPQIDKNRMMIVHCSVGHRSSLACSILKRNGFTNIKNMLGGITAWKKLKLPLENAESKRRL